MARLHIPFGSACRNDALEKRYFPNFDGVLVKRGFAALGVADDDEAHESRCGEPSGRQSTGGGSRGAAEGRPQAAQFYGADSSWPCVPRLIALEFRPLSTIVPFG